MFLARPGSLTRCLSKQTSASILVGTTPAKDSKRKNSQHRVILLPEIPADTAATNPILRPVTDGLPALDVITERQAFYGLGKAILQYESEVTQMEERCREALDQGRVPDFDEIFAPLERARVNFDGVWRICNMLHMTTDTIEGDRAIALHRRANKAANGVTGSEVIFDALCKMKEAHDKGERELDAERLRIVERQIAMMRSAGYGMPAKKREALKACMYRFDEPNTQYNYKTEWQTAQFRSNISDPNVVRDFPNDVLKEMAMDPAQPAKGPWTVTLHPYLYRKFLEYCPDRARRWNAYRARVNLGSGDYDDNSYCGGHVKEIRVQRKDQAAILGYSSYVDLSMEMKMAANVENVHSMIACLLPKAKDAQERELEGLQEYAESRGFEDDIKIYDIDFFKRKQRRTMLGMTDEDLRDYFPLPRLMNGIFALCAEMFGVRFEEVKEGVKAWDPSVKLFSVKDGDSGKVLGHFYFDPFLRGDKSYMGGDRGWFFPLRQHSVTGKSEPLSAMVLSLPNPGYGKPCLLNFEEARELLRLFGNLLLHTCATGAWSEVSGHNGIEQDAVDIAENFMTEWLYTPEFLTTVAGHWSSNQPLGQNVLDGLCSSRHHLAGLDLCTELFKSAYDIAFYTEVTTEHLHETFERLHPQYLLLPQEKHDTFPMNFTESVGGKLAASYYGGTWAKMLATDAFSAVRETGLENREEAKKVCRRFRSTFLETGSTLPTAEVFRQFRGRDPSHEALLLALGLKEMPKPKKRGQTQAEYESNVSQ